MMMFAHKPGQNPRRCLDFLSIGVSQYFGTTVCSLIERNYIFAPVFCEMARR